MNELEKLKMSFEQECSKWKKEDTIRQKILNENDTVLGRYFLGEMLNNVEKRPSFLMMPVIRFFSLIKSIAFLNLKRTPDKKISNPFKGNPKINSFNN